MRNPAEATARVHRIGRGLYFYAERIKWSVEAGENQSQNTCDWSVFLVPPDYPRNGLVAGP